MTPHDKHDCLDILGLFPDAAAGTLSPPSEGRLREHLEECEPCRCAWDRLGEASRAEAGTGLPGTPAPEGAPADYWGTFLPRVRARIAARGVTVRRSRPIWAVPAAAALVLGFCLGAGVATLVPRPANTTALASAVPSAPSDAEAPSYEEEILLPLSWDSAWNDDLTDRATEALNDQQQQVLMEELVKEIS